MKKLTAFVLALVCLLSLSGCSGSEVKVWDWAQGINQEDITSATPWRNDEVYKEFTPLNDAETLELVMLLNELTKDSFTHNKHLQGGTPIYGIKIIIASETYYLNQAIGPHGSLEMSFNEKLWWIENEELSAFVQSVTDSRPAE